MDKKIPSVLAVGIILIIAIIIGGFIWLGNQKQQKKALDTENKNQKELIQKSVQAEDSNKKRQALLDFYTEISSARDNQDWNKYYEYSPNEIKENVTKEQYIAHQKAVLEKNPFYSMQTVVNNVQINGDSGIINRTKIVCLNQECLGDNRVEQGGQISYVYLNGSWQVPNEPSERSLKAANDEYRLFIAGKEKENKDFLFTYAAGTTDSNLAIWAYALELDNNPEKVNFIENFLESIRQGEFGEGAKDALETYQNPSF